MKDMFEYSELRYHRRGGSSGDPRGALSRDPAPGLAGNTGNTGNTASTGFSPAQRRPGSTAGKPWDEEEHMQFLQGLNAFGKGQWKQISKYYVPSRTPTQVASHAQKHFLRATGNAKRKSKFANVDAVAEIRFGAAVTRDGMSGSVRHVGGVGVADISAAAAAAAAAEVAAAAKNETPRPPRSSKGRQASDSRGAATSEDTGSARQAFANGFGLYNPNGSLMVGKTIPPIQADGLALGIPLQEIPDLKAYGGTDLPMLKVIKGRIRATSNLFRPASPAPSQKKPVDGVENVESDGGKRRRKRVRRPINMEGEDFGNALVALANIAAGLADGHVY